MLILANKSTKIEYQELSSETVVTGFYFKLNYFNNSLLNQFIEESMLYRFLWKVLRMILKMLVIILFINLVLWMMCILYSIFTKTSSKDVLF